MSKERLYDAYGEIIYAITLADGIIQPEEIKQLKEIVKLHPWASQIKWSFDYESSKEKDVMLAYNSALITLKEHGPDPDYAHLVNFINEIASASNGIDVNEAKMIETFKTSLRNHFIENIKFEDLN